MLSPRSWFKSSVSVRMSIMTLLLISQSKMDCLGFLCIARIEVKLTTVKIDIALLRIKNFNRGWHQPGRACFAI